MQYRVHVKRMRKSLDAESTDYVRYLETQLKRTVTKHAPVLPERARYLISRIDEMIDLSEARVLCVGCRNLHELRYFESLGAREVKGIDLYSEWEQVEVMDMHDLRYPDAVVDVVYSSHSLEHSLNPEVAIKEFVRVLRPGGIIAIEVPVAFDRDNPTADIQDFGDPKSLLGLFPQNCDLQCLLCETDNPLDAGNDIVRVILRVDTRAELAD